MRVRHLDSSCGRPGHGQQGRDRVEFSLGVQIGLEMVPRDLCYQRRSYILLDYSRALARWSQFFPNQIAYREFANQTLVPPKGFIPPALVPATRLGRLPHYK